MTQHAFLALMLTQLQLNLRANIYEFILTLFIFTLTYHFIILFIPVDKCAPVDAGVANIHEHTQILVQKIVNQNVFVIQALFSAENKFPFV